MALYGILSDIHSNLEALRESLRFFRKVGVDVVICCGDIVGYGPFPNECVEEIAAIDNLVAVKGNHDRETYLHFYNPNWVNNLVEYSYPDAETKFGWKRSGLEDSIPFLESLDFTSRIRDIMVSHGCPTQPEEYLYVIDREDQKREERGDLEFEEHKVNLSETAGHLDINGVRILFYGHSHRPVMNLLYKFNENGAYIKTHSHYVNLRGNVRGVPLSMALINVGSVGQPRDGDRRACVALYDDEKQTIVTKRLWYNVLKTREAMAKQGIFEPFGRRLEFGR